MAQDYNTGLGAAGGWQEMYFTMLRFQQGGVARK